MALSYSYLQPASSVLPSGLFRGGQGHHGPLQLPPPLGQQIFPPQVEQVPPPADMLHLLVRPGDEDWDVRVQPKRGQVPVAEGGPGGETIGHFRLNKYV